MFGLIYLPTLKLRYQEQCQPYDLPTGLEFTVFDDCLEQVSDDPFKSWGHDEICEFTCPYEGASGQPDKGNAKVSFQPSDGC